MMLVLGADKGLHGVGLFIAEPSATVAKNAIRHLADFKGKKMRAFASQFQTEAFNRLGATAVVMTLGDVLPALQQGAIDGAVAGIGPFTKMHFNDAAKYITLTNQASIFLAVEVNKNGTILCPPICRKSSIKTPPPRRLPSTPRRWTCGPRPKRIGSPLAAN